MVRKLEASAVAPIWAVAALCLLSGCGLNDRTIVNYKLEPVHFLNADTLHYLETRKSETQDCTLFSGCGTTSRSETVSDRCYSFKQHRNVTCPPLEKLSFPTPLDSVDWKGQRFRLLGFIVKDNKTLGFASASFNTQASGHENRMSYLYMARPDATQWSLILENDSCLVMSTIGHEARFIETRDICLDPTETGATIRFLGVHPDTPFIGDPVPKSQVPAYVLGGVLSTDSSKYARWIFLGNSAGREAIGVFSREGIPIDTVLGPKSR